MPSSKPHAFYEARRECVPHPGRCQARRLVQNILTHLGVDSVRDGRLSTSRWVPFLGFVLGLRFALPETLRRHFSRAVAAAVTFVSRCGDFNFVSRHKPAEHRIPNVSATLDVEASCITSCRGRRDPLLGELAGGKPDPRRSGPSCSLQSVRLCLRSSGLQTSELGNILSARHQAHGCLRSKAPGCLFSRLGPAYPLCKAQGCLRSTKAQGCLTSRLGTRLPEVKSTRLLDFQTQHKVA